MAYEDKFKKIHGPYKRPDGRSIVIVVDRRGKRRTVSFPKWIMEKHLGRKLHPDKETVDHWDSNKDNNSLDNLRIMPRKEHSREDTRRVKPIEMECAWCSKKFERSARRLRDKAKKGNASGFCSRSCAGKYSRMVQLKIIDKRPAQEHVESEYYKKKYASFEDWMAFEDLEEFRLEDLMAEAELFED